MTAIAVRPATAGDLDAMSRVLIASIRKLCEADHRGDPAILAGWLRNKTPAALAVLLANPASSFFVAERGGEIAAVGCIDSAGAVRLNYVAPEHRFSGVSKALLAALEAELKARGIERATLDSTETAHRFYLAAGWRDAGDLDLSRPVAAHPMQKRL